MNIYLKAILGAILFSLLFYTKSLGLNIFLISVITTIILHTTKKDRRPPWHFSLANLFTALMVFVEPSGFHVFAYFLTLFILIGKSISNKSSIYLSWFIGLINLSTASIIRLVEGSNTAINKRKDWSSKTTTYIKGTLIALLLLLLFILLYRNANPIFDTIITQIDLSFISFPWLLFTVVGYFIFFHLLFPYKPTELLKYDAAQGNNLQSSKESFSLETIQKLQNEHTLGCIIFTTLNILLLFFLATDIIYLLNPNIIQNSDYSQSVHQGIYALMFSIVCAIGIILYFFRKNLNFYDKNTPIKQLAYSWIVLNIILVAFIVFKNWIYVEALGLTYKRIGVFVYLALTLVGLTTAYIKVSKIKSFLFLLRTNIAILFYLVIASSAIPWDSVITSYNLSTIKNPDINYLLQLGDSNTVQLYNYIKHAKTREQRNEIIEKYNNYIKKQSDKGWQEYTYFHFNNLVIK
ncbi:MAG: DUF4173 domain-containing protein [Cellulophaga sp.]